MQTLTGAPLCPTCNNRVYHAEQTIGPGRKMYHKPCLICVHCKKRLDAYSLLEHDQQAYCKRCHTTLFGTRDLRSANVLPSPSGSNASPGGNTTVTPFGTRTLSNQPIPSSPTPRSTFISGHSGMNKELGGEVGDDKAKEGSEIGMGRSSLEGKDEDKPKPKGLYDDFVMPRITPRPPPTTDVFSSSSTSTSTPTTTSTKSTTTTTIHPNFSTSSSRPLPKPHHAPGSLDARGLLPKSMSPRAKFGGGGTLGGGGETCEGCGKVVYFAEGISAIGRRWHKSCLKCSECKSTVEAGKVTDRNGKPWCRNCYHKLFGPPGIIGR